MKNLRERLVCIAWEEGIEGTHGADTWVCLERVVQPSAVSTTVCSSCACDFDRAARRCPACSRRVSKQRKPGPEPGSTASQNSPERLSCQMYGNLNVDVNALKELSEPREDGLQLSEVEQSEAAGLIKEIYLPQSLSQEGGPAVFASNSSELQAREEQRRQGDIAWKAALAQQNVVDSGRSAESSATFSASAVNAAMTVIANAEGASRRRRSKGLGSSPYWHACLRRAAPSPLPFRGNQPLPDAQPRREHRVGRYTRRCGRGCFLGLGFVQSAAKRDLSNCPSSRPGRGRAHFGRTSTRSSCGICSRDCRVHQEE